MELSQISLHIEALIFASEKPLSTNDIYELMNAAFGFLEDRITIEEIRIALEAASEKYDTDLYPFEIKEQGGGWQFLTKPVYYKTIVQLNKEKYLKRLSAAAMETLAIVAYKQPVTKGEIEAVRGVNSEYSLQKLLEKELIAITGRSETLPGKPLLYATSRSFMDHFGINNTTDLPKIKEVSINEIVAPTLAPAMENMTADNTIEKKLYAIDNTGNFIVENENDFL